MQSSVTHSGRAKLPLLETAKEGKTWDERKSQSVIVSHFYFAALDEWLKGYGSKVAECANVLEFSKEPDEDGLIRFVFARAWFCKVRFCPMCQWRRQNAWQARFIKAKATIEHQWPKHSWLLLTLTVKNCRNEVLRDTINALNLGFRKLTRRKDWPADGWVKAIEVTKQQDRYGYSHPHIHAVLMVPPGYFKGGKFISQARWAEIWKEVMQLDYEPMVDIRKVRANEAKDKSAFDVAMTEVLKYAVKPQDLTAERNWLHEITHQLFKSRWVSVGGVLRQVLSDNEPEPDEASNPELKGGHFAHYDAKSASYKLEVNDE